MAILRVLLSTVLCIAFLCMGTATQASAPLVWISTGVKGTIGGNRITEPSDRDIYASEFGDAEVLPFMDGAGGTGGGGGIFGEVRIFRQHLALEVDMLFDANKTWYQVDSGNAVQMEYVLRYTTIRLPLLLKANLKTGATRFGFCIGPEFRWGLWAGTRVDITENGDRITPEDIAGIRSAMSIKKRNDVGLTWGMSLAFDVSPMEITLDLRFSHFLTWPREYGDRVKIEMLNDEMAYSYQAGHSVDGRILFGVAWVFSQQRPLKNKSPVAKR